MTGDTERVRNAGHDDWLDAVESDAGYYLECENGHGLLPPRRVCPHCGSRDITEEPLPESGTVVAQTTVHVPAPSFQGDSPYTTAIAEFGPVQITGQVRRSGAEVVDESVEGGAEDGATVENGAEVEISVGETGQGERLVVFTPV